jgi:ABC-type nitrate/sulfonate/bicarbonate transport system substrate-binding protein
MSHPLVGRRELLRRSLAVGATITGAGLLAACDRRPPSSATSPSASLPPPETATVRIASPFACDAPLWMAKDFLREEGFTDVQWVPNAPGTAGWITSGVADVGPGHPEAIVAAIDAGVPIVTLAGLHTGCQSYGQRPASRASATCAASGSRSSRRTQTISSFSSSRPYALTSASIRSRT